MNVWASLVAQTVKNLPAMQNIWVRSLGGRSPGEGNGYPYLTLCDSVNCSPPGSSVHGILQARILQWVANPSSRWSSWCRGRTHISYVSCIDRQILYCLSSRQSTTYRAYHTSSNFTHKHLPKRNKKICLNREICINVHSCFIQNSIKLETIQMNKQTCNFLLVQWLGLHTSIPEFSPW